MGTSWGNARVRPDGRVHVNITLKEENYRALFAWCRSWGMSMGEALDMLCDAQRAQGMRAGFGILDAEVGS